MQENIIFVALYMLLFCNDCSMEIVFVGEFDPNNDNNNYRCKNY